MYSNAFYALSRTLPGHLASMLRKLSKEGVHTSRKRVARLLREAGLRAKGARKYNATVVPRLEGTVEQTSRQTAPSPPMGSEPCPWRPSAASRSSLPAASLRGATAEVSTRAGALSRDQRSHNRRALVAALAWLHGVTMNITGNTIFIPGATSGIGLALALALQAKGNTVIVGGRRVELLAKITAEHPGLQAVQIDTTDTASIQQTASQVIAKHPALNVLITMAGIMRTEDWTKPSGFLSIAEETITTNLLGPIRLIAAFIEHLCSRPNATIMTVSSGLAFAPLKITPTYNATKAAIHMLSESIRLQFAGTSVKVVELEPPSVKTDLMPGQKESAFAMPLEDFISEVVTLIETQPDAKEIQVKNVKFLRYGEARGEYDHVVATLNRLDPHGK